MEQLGSRWTDFHGIWYLSVIRKSVEKIRVHSNGTRITGTLREDLCTFTIISRSILTMRNVLDTNCRENQNTILHSIISSRKLFRLCDNVGAGIAQSVSRLATGWTVRGLNPGGGEIFRTRPDGPWGPPSLLYNGYRVFPREKAARAWCWPPTHF
jgi:hypothetical protein